MKPVRRQPAVRCAPDGASAHSAGGVRAGALALALVASVGVLAWLALTRSDSVPAPDPGEQSADTEQASTSERATWERWALTEEEWRDVEASEALIIVLVPDLDRLAASVSNLSLPDARTRRLFAELVTFRDVSATPSPVPEGCYDVSPNPLAPLGGRGRKDDPGSLS